MFGWNANTAKINLLIQKKKYSSAVKLLRKELKKSPESTFIRQQLAGLLGKTGEKKEAMQIMNRVASEYTASGFLTKALAMYKQMQRLEPDQVWIHNKINDLGKEHRSQYSIQAQQAIVEQAPKAVPKPTPVPQESMDQGIEISAVEDDLEFDVQGGSIRDTGIEMDDTEDTGDPLPGPDPIYASPLFKNISESDLSAFIHGLDYRVFEPGEIIFSEGEPGHSLMVLASGSLRVYVRGQEGRSEPVRILEEGAFFGEISLLSRKPRTATITAMSFVEILELDLPTLTRIAQKHPDIPHILKEFYLKRVNSPEEQKARR